MLAYVCLSPCIPADLVSAIEDWKEKCPKNRLELVFCNEFGEPCDRTGIGRYGLAPALKQAEIEKAVGISLIPFWGRTSGVSPRSSRPSPGLSIQYGENRS